MLKLAKPYIPDSAYEKVKEILESGNLIQGKYVRQFEQKVQEYLDVPNALMVSSGTAALHLALLALDIKLGDEVIVPAFTYPATVNVVEIVGAKPVLVDINLIDFCIDVQKIEQKITNKTKAIIPVHEFGQAADIKTITDLCKKYNLKLIEDAACALGSEYNGKKAGTYGDFGCFSLHPRKAITTGEGGIVVTSNERLAEKIKLFRNHGAYKKDCKLDFYLPGLNYRMTEFQAAIGIPQLEEIDSIINKRKEQAGIYNDLLQNIENIDIPETFENRKHVYQTYHILLKNKNRDRLIKELRKQQIETNLGAQALHCLTYYREKYDYKKTDFVNAAFAYNQGLALPLGRHLKLEDIKKVSCALKEIV